jgi:hypothetical protein
VDRGVAKTDRMKLLTATNKHRFTVGKIVPVYVSIVNHTALDMVILH